MSIENRLENTPVPVHFIERSPKGWLGAVIAQNRENFTHTSADLLAAQELRWEEKTGVAVKNSRFTIIVPIHDEEKFLSSFLSSLMIADFPHTAPMNIVFITNDCSDQSSQIVANFMKKMSGGLEDQQIAIDDTGLRQPMKVARMQNITLMHLDTATRGKANALRIGNNLAASQEHAIAMSIDANNFVEPNAIAQLFKSANEFFEVKKEKTVLISGLPRGVRLGLGRNPLLDVGREINKDISAGSSSVNGWLMAWSTDWLKNIDGPPQVAIEDYALGVMARIDGFNFQKIPEAVIWGYIPNNVADTLSSRIRYIRGRHQLMKQVPASEEIVRADHYFMRKTLMERTKVFLSELKEIKDTPFSLLRKVGNFFIWEYVLRKGFKQYLSNPESQSWEPLHSTK